MKNKIRIISRKEADQLIESNFPNNTAVISFLIRLTGEDWRAEKKINRLITAVSVIVFLRLPFTILI